MFKLTQLETTTIYRYFFLIWSGHLKLVFLLLPVDPRHYFQILFQGIKQAYPLLLMSCGEDFVVQCLRANISLVSLSLLREEMEEQELPEAKLSTMPEVQSNKEKPEAVAYMGRGEVRSEFKLRS